MSNNKQDPRAHVAMNMTSDIFLNSTTKFSGIAKLPLSQAVDQRLKQRVQEAIKSKSPENKKIDVGRISQLGTSGLWKGLDLAPQRNSRSPGNQQRLKTSANQSSLSPGRQRIQTVQNNIKNQKQPEIKVNQNSQPKHIQRNHNRNAQNQVNTSRYRTQIRQVHGNIVSQNLIRNQKSTKDDFSVGDKSNDKKRKYSNQNQKSKVLLPNAKNQARNTTQSRAISEVNEKRVSFSPEKPKQHSIEKRQVVQVKKTVQLKPTLKVTNSKQEPYVYVPPQKRVPHSEDETVHHHSQSYAPKVQTSQNKVQAKPVPYRSLSPKKEDIKKPDVSIQIKPKVSPIKPVQQKPVVVQQKPIVNQPKPVQPIRIKSRAEIIAEQQSMKKNTSSPTYSYQPPQRTQVVKRQEIKIEEKKTVTIQRPSIVEKKPQVSPPKVQPISPSAQNKSLIDNKPVVVNKTVINQQNIEIRRVTNVIKTTPNNNSKNNVSLDVSSKQKSPNKNQSSSPNIISRKRVDFSPQELRKDWSKIKDGLRYDKSLSPSRQNSRKVPERQDVAMKMLAQIFLNASTRFFPGMSLLLKRGVSKQQIDEMRSKSSQFKINVISASDKKSPSKQQPKTERKLNWRQEQADNKAKENNRMYQNDVTATQYKVKKPEEVEQKKVQTIKIQTKPQSRVVEKASQKVAQKSANKSTNIVSVSLEKNHKNLTRDDSILDKHKREPSDRSNSIRESPDVYHRQISKKDVEDSKKQVAKMKSEALRQSTNYSPPKKQEGYVYQPPVKKVSPSAKQSTEPSKPVIVNQVKTPQAPSASQKKQQKPVQPTPIARQSIVQREPVKVVKPEQKPQPKQIVNLSKSQTSIMQKPQSKPIIPVKSPVKQEQKPISHALDASKTSISVQIQHRQESKSPSKQQNYSYTPSKPGKKQQGYVYQPPVPRGIQSPPKVIETPKPIKPINQSQVNNIISVQPKQQPKQVPKQLIQSKSVTNIIQAPQKPVNSTVQKPSEIKPKIEEVKPKAPEIKTPMTAKPAIQQKKPVQVVQPKPQPVKTQQPKPQQQTAQKNISIISSKSQTSLIQQKKPQPQTPKNQSTSYTYQPINKKVDTSSSYVYQPPTKKETNIGTQPIIPAKVDNSSTLRSVQSEKVIKTIDAREVKTPETTMIKKEHKISTIENKTVQAPVKIPEPVKKPQPKVNPSTIISQVKIQQKVSESKKDQRPSIQIAKKTQTSVQASVASKRFITIITLILKKRLSSNYSQSFNKIRQQSQYRAQLQKHASFLSRSMLTFSHNYQKILKRDSFKRIKTSLVTQVNKIIKENKPVQENNNFTSGRKQSAARIIFWLLRNKLRSYMKPIRKQYLSIQNKGKTREQVLEALAVVIKRRSIIFLKDGFKSIKSYRNQRQAALQNFANIVSKLRYTAVSENFSTFVNKDIKQLGSTVKKLKQETKARVAPQPPKTLTASKSQQTLPTYTIKKQESEKLSQIQKQLNPNEQAKLEQKRKQLDRKINDLENRKQSLQQQVNNENKEKRNKTKKNAELKVLLKQLQQELSLQQANAPPVPETKRQNSLHEHDLIPILTRIYAYLFEDDQTSQIIVERFLSDNQHCFQLPTNPALLNEWKIINKNAELKRLIKIYEGEQPREKKINEVLQQQNLLMSKLLRSFIRQRYIWQWVNIIAHQ